MPKASKPVVETNLRTEAMKELSIDSNPNFVRMSNQSYGIVLDDANGVSRLVEVRFVVANYSEEISASELLAAKVAEMALKKAKAEEVQAAKNKKAAADKKKRAEKAAAEAAEAAENSTPEALDEAV